MESCVLDMCIHVLDGNHRPLSCPSGRYPAAGHFGRFQQCEGPKPGVTESASGFSDELIGV